MKGRLSYCGYVNRINVSLSYICTLKHFFVLVFPLLGHPVLLWDYCKGRVRREREEIVAASSGSSGRPRIGPREGKYRERGKTWRSGWQKEKSCVQPEMKKDDKE